MSDPAPPAAGSAAHGEFYSGRRAMITGDAWFVGVLVRDRDVKFNLAGQVSHIDSMRDPYTDLEISCRAPLSILEAFYRAQFCEYANKLLLDETLR